jgi:hypothetical protein
MRNLVYDSDPGVLAWVSMSQPLVNTDTLNVDSDVTDRAARDLGKVDIASLDQYTPVSGRLPVDGSGVVQSAKIVDAQNSKDVAVTAFRELKAVTSFRLVGTTFSGTTKDTNFWTETVTGSGTVVQAGEISLTTGETADSTAKYVSVRGSRYVPSSVNQFRGICRFTTTGTANNTRRIGAYNATDGFFFQLAGTVFSVGSRKSSSDTLVSSGSFNGNAGVSYALDTNVHRFTIDITNLSAQFYIDDVLIHTISSATDSLTTSLTLPITFENNNSGGSVSPVALTMRVVSIVRLGNPSTQAISKFIQGITAGVVCKYGAGNIHGLIVTAVTNNSVITLYDNTAASGTVIWSSGAMGAQTQPYELEMHDIPFSIGLTVVIATANSSILIMYE